MLARSQHFLLAALTVSFGASLFSHSINPYFLDVALTCGINITLAVSLNLINGYTGQFSLGHAGFMAICTDCSIGPSAAISSRSTR